MFAFCQIITSPWWMAPIMHYFGAVSHELGKCHYLQAVTSALSLVNDIIKVEMLKHLN